MEIKINEEKINFELENEKTIGEIISVIRNWIYGSGFIITSVFLDNREIKIDEQSGWQDIPVADIKTLNIKINHVTELRAANLKTVTKYLGMLSEAVGSSDKKMYRELLSGFPFMLESLGSNYILNKNTDSLGRIIKETSVDDIMSLNNDEKEEIIRLISEIIANTEEALNEIQYPAEALRSITDKLHASAEEIGEVSVLLQSGNDKQAMDYVVKFSDLTQRFFRILTALGDSGKIQLNSIKIQGKKSSEFYHDLNNILNQLLDAFHVQDSVLIGDLLEYEIAPRMEILMELSRGLL
ncbi:MAG: hypothetical protein J7K04_03345 [Spirochaetales bacterium]|nr:hypothetical protein [Spirochaetales bacterium]